MGSKSPSANWFATGGEVMASPAAADRRLPQARQLAVDHVPDDLGVNGVVPVDEPIAKRDDRLGFRHLFEDLRMPVGKRPLLPR